MGKTQLSYSFSCGMVRAVEVAFMRLGEPDPTLQARTACRLLSLGLPLDCFPPGSLCNSSGASNAEARAFRKVRTSFFVRESFMGLLQGWFEPNYL